MQRGLTQAQLENQRFSFTGKNKVDIRTENHTQVDGAVIAADNGNLKLDTGTLGFSDIAGQDKASDESFRQAIYMAIDIYKNRKLYDEARRNPLHKMFFDRGKDDEKLDLTADEAED